MQVQKKRQDLLQRVELIIDNLYEFLALKQYGEVSHQMLQLFQQALDIKNHIADKHPQKEFNPLQQRAKVLEDTTEQLEQCGFINKVQGRQIQQNRQIYIRMKKLIEDFYIVTSQIKYTEIVMSSINLLEGHICKYREIVQGMEQQLKKAQQKDRQASIKYQGLVTKEILEEYESIKRQKQEQIQNFRQSSQAISQEYQKLVNQYNDILQKNNSEKLEDIKRGTAFPQKSTKIAQILTHRSKKESLVKVNNNDNKMVIVKQIPDKSGLGSEQIVGIVLLFITVVMLVYVAFK